LIGYGSQEDIINPSKNPVSIQQQQTATTIYLFIFAATTNNTWQVAREKRAKKIPLSFPPTPTTPKYSDEQDHHATQTLGTSPHAMFIPNSTLSVLKRSHNWTRALAQDIWKASFSLSLSLFLSHTHTHTLSLSLSLSLSFIHIIMSRLTALSLLLVDPHLLESPPHPTQK
jgi:hypothetical protein